MSLLIGVGDFGIAQLVADATTAKTEAQQAATTAQNAAGSAQSSGGTTVDTVADIPAIQNTLGPDDLRDVFVRTGKEKYLVTKTTANRYATIQ